MPIPTIKAGILSGLNEVVCGMSTRKGGVSGGSFGMNLSFNVGDEEQKVRTNRELFFAELGVDVEQAAFAGQIHSGLVRYADSPGKYPECDGLITDSPGVFLAISVADCVPILLYDPVRKVAAALHAGWRGTDARIVARGIGMLTEKFDSQPRNILAFIGPAAGECCYEVGEEVSDRFEPGFSRRTERKIMLDLKGLNKVQLLDAGVPEGNIEVNPLCTIMERDLLHSYRRDGPASGRMLAVIGMKGSIRRRECPPELHSHAAFPGFRRNKSDS